jgi:undecaprenyl-diphosphatase
MTLVQTIIIGIVEGITEFLPISSTGHMMITQWLLGIPSDEFTKAFLVNIQFGAILSVIVLYWKRFLQSLDFYYKLIIAFIPAAILGFLFNDTIDELLSNVLVVGITLLLGGIVLVFVDKWFAANEQKEPEAVTPRKAFIIGLFQCISMIPGVSRSAATIIGGLTQKMNRKTAAEFSFFLAVPTMFAASGYKLLKLYMEPNGMGIKILSDNFLVLLVGNVVAFIVAWLAIKSFIAFLTKNGFKVFGWYRIVVGVIIVALWIAGANLSLN